MLGWLALASNPPLARKTPCDGRYCCGISESSHGSSGAQAAWTPLRYDLPQRRLRCLAIPRARVFLAQARPRGNSFLGTWSRTSGHRRKRVEQRGLANAALAATHVRGAGRRARLRAVGRARGALRSCRAARRSSLAGIPAPTLDTPVHRPTEATEGNDWGITQRRSKGSELDTDPAPFVPSITGPQSNKRRSS